MSSLIYDINYYNINQNKDLDKILEKNKSLVSARDAKYQEYDKEYNAGNYNESNRCIEEYEILCVKVEESNEEYKKAEIEKNYKDEYFGIMTALVKSLETKDIKVIEEIHKTKVKYNVDYSTINKIFAKSNLATTTNIYSSILKDIQDFIKLENYSTYIRKFEQYPSYLSKLYFVNKDKNKDRLFYFNKFKTIIFKKYNDLNQYSKYDFSKFLESCNKYYKILVDKINEFNKLFLLYDIETFVEEQNVKIEGRSVFYKEILCEHIQNQLCGEKEIDMYEYFSILLQLKNLKLSEYIEYVNKNEENLLFDNFKKQSLELPDVTSSRTQKNEDELKNIFKSFYKGKNITKLTKEDYKEEYGTPKNFSLIFVNFCRFLSYEFDKPDYDKDKYYVDFLIDSERVVDTKSTYLGIYKNKCPDGYQFFCKKNYKCVKDPQECDFIGLNSDKIIQDMDSKRKKFYSENDLEKLIETEIDELNFKYGDYKDLTEKDYKEIKYYQENVLKNLHLDDVLEYELLKNLNNDGTKIPKRSNKKRSNKKRSNKKRSNKKRSNKKRSIKKRSNKKRSIKKRSNKKIKSKK